MTALPNFVDIAKQTVVKPLSGFRDVIALNLGMRRAIELLVLIVAVNILVQEALIALVTMFTDEPANPMIKTQGPVFDAALAFIFYVMVIIGIWLMGKVVSKETPLEDVIIMFSWLQLLLLIAQIALIPLMLIALPLALILGILLSLAALPYYLTCGVMAVHDFRNVAGVIGGLLLVAMGIGLLIQPILYVLGIEITMGPNV
ncbi:MAG: hypothetical protein AAF826_07930 [Pseudomonadota bacterium]